MNVGAGVGRGFTRIGYCDKRLVEGSSERLTRKHSKAVPTYGMHNVEGKQK